MKSTWTVLWLGGVVLTLAGVAQAQVSGAPPAPAAPAAPSAASGAAGAGGNGIAIVIMVAAAVVVLVAIAKFIDLRRKRSEEAVALEAQVSDALLRDRNFVGRSVTPTVHLPFWSGSPATIRLSGPVPAREIRELAVRITEHEATRLRSDIRIEDHMVEKGEAAPQAA